MEYIEGVKASNVQAIQASGLDRSALATAALTAIVKMLLIDGFFHADPHPGNIIVNLKTGMLTLLDTGMVGELGLQGRLNLIQLLIAVQQNDIPAQAQLLRNMSVPFREDIDEKGFYKDYERVAAEVKKQAMLTAREALKRLPSLSDATLGWLDQYQKGRFEVHVETSEVAKEVTKITRLGRQAVVAVMLVAVIVGSAITAAGIAIGNPQGGIWQFAAKVAFWGYCIGAVVAMLLALRGIWRWLRHKEEED
jgi:predicted unusual protein kinase regulating ubiquinone biosynthesis (AarF/ABC1/UbiB family)